jgi:hypothetical protein
VQLSVDKMESFLDKKERKQQEALQNNSLLYMVKHAANECKATWDDITTAYNHMAELMGMKSRTADGLKYAHKVLLKNTKTMRGVKKEIQQGHWVQKEATIKKLLLGGPSSVRPPSLDLETSWQGGEQAGTPEMDCAISLAADSSVVAPTATRVLSSSLLATSDSTGTVWEPDLCTTTSPDASSLWMQDESWSNESVCMEEPAAVDAASAAIPAVVDTSARVAADPYNYYMMNATNTMATDTMATDVMATNVLARMVWNTSDYTGSHPTVESIATTAQPCNDIAQDTLDDSAAWLSGQPTTINAGCTPTNTPMYMPTPAFGLTAVPALDLQVPSLLDDSAAIGLERTSTCWANSTITYPHMQGTKGGAMESPTLGACCGWPYQPLAPAHMGCRHLQWSTQSQSYHQGECRALKFGGFS